MLSKREKIRNAFSSRNLKVRSVSPDGTLEWRPVLAVHRAEVPGETIVEIKTTHGPMTLTGGHRVFVSPTQKVEAEQLLVGQTVWGLGSTRTVVQVMRVPNRRYMYDLTADEWHNFILYRSGVLISNSPDRNYRFRPPAHEKTVNQFNQVFGYIWEDDELKEYLERSLDSISLAPPYTPFQSIDNLVSRYPAWRTLLLTGGMIHALQAVRLNWISEEFSYSVGGISLDLEKSSKYEGALSTAVDQFDKQLEKAKQTINVVRGLQQPRYGVGIRSSFGPYSGRGVLSPRKFLGLVIPLVLTTDYIMDLFTRGLTLLS